ncbi:hypothetical protein THAOC_22078, partial [Thalassiosira oceanica]
EIADGRTGSLGPSFTSPAIPDDQHLPAVEAAWPQNRIVPSHWPGHPSGRHIVPDEAQVHTARPMSQGGEESLIEIDHHCRHRPIESSASSPAATARRLADRFVGRQNGEMIVSHHPEGAL